MTGECSRRARISSSLKGRSAYDKVTSLFIQVFELPSTIAAKPPSIHNYHLRLKHCILVLTTRLEEEYPQVCGQMPTDWQP